MKQFLILFALLTRYSVGAQSNSQIASQYPQGYFRNPLNIPILLAGNFGEVRPNHFHSGIDIKTNGKENLPVYAAAEGYVSRIKMEKGGFGHALYISHPNGFTTLYAHLNNFAPQIQSYLKKIQYQKESWAVDLQLTPEQFPVKKGEQIAWSGNTGGSTAPHLHFEIRDSKTEHPLNPQLFGFYITDSRSPVPTQIALYDLNRSIFEQTPLVVNLRKAGDQYRVPSDTIIINTDRLGVGINVNDYMNGSDNTLNFYVAKWYKDDMLQGQIKLDNISYGVTRYLHAYVDYKSRKSNGTWYQLLFQLPGNRLNGIYPFLNEQQGAMTLRNQETSNIRLELTDAAGNTSSISFHVKSEGNTMKEDCANVFSVGKPNTLEHPNVRFEIDANGLYDDVCFKLDLSKDERALSDKIRLHQPFVPVHKYFTLSIKPNTPISFTHRNKIVTMYSDGKTEEARAATFENGWYNASVRSFGTYWLITDTTAPAIKPLQPNGANLSKATRINFRVTENITSVKSFRAELDGRWLAFEPRGDIFFYTFDEHCPRGKHKLTVTASDENNNSKTLVYTFTR
jgi:hypothetical protein